MAELGAEAIAATPARDRIVAQPSEVDAATLHIPRALVRRALTALLENAMEASGNGQGVELRCLRRADLLGFEVRDRGRGIPAEALERVREPFFTTKPIGEGMGLGLHLADSVARDLGGQLDIAAREGGGTVVSLWLPERAPE
jgi:signal transduction histidine kinase